MTCGRWFATTWLTMGLLAVVARAGAPPATLSRYAPGEKLLAYFEFDGLKAHRAAWEKTAASKVYHQTKLGPLAEDLARQALDALAQTQPGFRPARDSIIPLLTHLKDHGFAVAFFGEPTAPHRVFVARGAGTPAMLGVFAKIGAPAGKPVPEPRNGRKLIEDGGDGYRWSEGDDLVLTDRGGFDAVVASLDGKAPGAVDHAIRSALTKPEDGFEPVALGFVDIAAYGPMPPEAVAMGLDGAKRVEFRWGFHDEALVATARLVAPAPRRGLLALLDQPTFDVKSLPPFPASQHSFAALSIAWEKTHDAILALAKATDPNSARRMEEFATAFRDYLGMDLRADLLPLLGPKTTIHLSPVETPQAAFPDPRVAGFLTYAGLVVSMESKDDKATSAKLEQLIPAINAAIAARVGNLPRPPKFVREKGEGVAHVMDVAPLNPPPFLANLLSPTIAVGGGRIVISPNRDAARLAIAAATDPGQAWKPADKFIPLAQALPAGMILLGVDDVRDSIPQLIENLPQIAAILNARVAEETGRDDLAVRVDPAMVPTADELRPFLFPASMAFSVDDEGIAYRQRESIPSVTSPATSGVLIALLLPAVQSAREAARRAQCVNNEKQIALAFHNHHAATDAFPGDIVDKDGKPLLSWRVAILPYLEQRELYDKFKLDEPWDSPHNKPLLDEMPSVYVCPSVPNPGRTECRYQGLEGPGTMFEPGKKIALPGFIDGTSFTLMVVESTAGVPWTKPGGIPFDPDAPGSLDGVGSIHPGGFNAVFADGAVRFLKSSLSPSLFKKLVTRNGGEVVNVNELSGR